MENKTGLGVYQAINAVQAELAEIGISKNQKNSQQNYKFRGIDDVYNALSGLLAKHGLVIVPHHKVTSRDLHQNQKGTTLFYVFVESQYDIVAVSDGSSHQANACGEAMDSGDKATNKAMSASFKYAMMQLFCIPTEGDNDADATTHTVAPPNPGKMLLKEYARDNKLSGELIKAAATTVQVNPNNCTIAEAQLVINELKEADRAAATANTPPPNLSEIPF